MALRTALTVLVIVALPGCNHPGEGDRDAALEVVYDQQGSPAFAGQALVIQSCGNGAFCHADNVEVPEDHFGAPDGLEFDLRVASSSIEAEEEEAIRLLRDQGHIIDNFRLVWEQVSSGRMPPQPIPSDYQEEIDSVQYDRFADDGVTFSPLPRIDTDEGREIFRNWLASGAPVVERTECRIDNLCNVTGFTIPSCARTCVDPTWESIYTRILEPSCGRGRCHDDTEPAGMLNLVTGGPSAVLARLIDGPAEGTRCAGETLLVRDSPDTSLLYTKVAADSSDEVCGARMPLAGTRLSSQRLCALREWIRCGACEDPTDCATAGANCTLEEMRAECDVVEDGVCTETAECPNRNSVSCPMRSSCP